MKAYTLLDKIPIGSRVITISIIVSGLLENIPSQIQAYDNVGSMGMSWRGKNANDEKSSKYIYGYKERGST